MMFTQLIYNFYQKRMKIITEKKLKDKKTKESRKIDLP